MLNKKSPSYIFVFNILLTSATLHCCSPPSYGNKCLSFVKTDINNMMALFSRPHISNIFPMDRRFCSLKKFDAQRDFCIVGTKSFVTYYVGTYKGIALTLSNRIFKDYI